MHILEMFWDEIKILGTMLLCTIISSFCYALFVKYNHKQIGVVVSIGLFLILLFCLIFYFNDIGWITFPEPTNVTVSNLTGII